MQPACVSWLGMERRALCERSAAQAAPPAPTRAQLTPRPEVRLPAPDHRACPSSAHLDAPFDAHQDANVRTTVTLDPRLLAGIREVAHRKGLSFKAALHEIVERGLTSPGRSERAARFVVKPHRGGFRVGVDPQRLNQLVDELGVDSFVEGEGRRS